MKKNRTFNSLKPIRTLLPENVKKLIKNKPITDFDSLRNSWNRVLGEETAKKCQLIKIEKNNNKKSVFLKVDRQHLVEIDYSRDEIIKKINSFLGYEYVNKILVNIEDNGSTQIKEKSLKLNKKTEGIIKIISDEALREKLLNFANKGKK